MGTAVIDGRILNAIEGQRYLIHRSNEKEYADLGESGVCIEVVNGKKGSSIFIERTDEYTLYFGYMHSHYSTDDDTDISELAGLVDGILHNRICVASVGSRTKDGRFEWRGSTYCTSEKAQNADAETLFSPEYPVYKRRMHCNELVLQYWDGALDKVLPVSTK